MSESIYEIRMYLDSIRPLIDIRDRDSINILMTKIQHIKSTQFPSFKTRFLKKYSQDSKANSRIKEAETKLGELEKMTKGSYASTEFKLKLNNTYSMYAILETYPLSPN